MVWPNYVRDRNNFAPRSKREGILLLAVMLVLLGAGAFCLPNFGSNEPLASFTNTALRTAGDRETTTPFSLLVTLQFSATEHKETFLKDIQPLAEYIKTSEPMTLAYEVLLSDKDPLQVLILERYQDKEVAFVQVHRSSEPFQAFRPKLQAMQEAGHVTVSGHSYLDAGLGFGDRA